MALILKDRKSYIQKSEFEEKRFRRFIDEIVKDTGREYDESVIEEIKVQLIDELNSKQEIEADKLFDLIIRAANDRINVKSPHFTYLSASAMRRKLYKHASKERGFDYHKGYGDYYSLVYSSTEKGIYAGILDVYSEKEIRQAGKLIQKELDRKFSYGGLFLLNENYTAKDYNGETLELPQERLLTTALYLLRDENKNMRMDLVKEAYWAFSNHLIGNATPTLSNSGRPNGTLSSCHIITIDDDLRSIMRALDDTAIFSQNGAGLGIFLGFLRARGSWIRGYKGRATGITHPARLFNVVAEYVNQLGVRPGGIALYLPVWHLDVNRFLELRLKTGSQELRAHTIKTAVTIPDEFMRRVENKQTWTIVDPYEVKKKLGIDINRLYDKKKLQDGEEPNEEDHAFTYNYRLIEKADLELKEVHKATDIYKNIFLARKTGGTPYMYYHDTCARMNPNPHAGMPLGSNLCSEIIQNMVYDKIDPKVLDGNGVVVSKYLGEGLVTCNLSSLCLHNVFAPGSDIDLQRVVDIQMRLLDNVISLTRTVVPQATNTNNLYRAVGAGGLGLATHYADMGIQWESEEASEYADKLFSKISQARIKASSKLGIEKGSYPLFHGSDWNTGEYFVKRGYVKRNILGEIEAIEGQEDWHEVCMMAMETMRCGYNEAYAPTGSNSVIMNGSPSLDAPYEVIYQEEKSGASFTVVPPNYNNKTKWFYKSAFEMDEMWSLKIIAAVQKHCDQAISHNMHVHKSIKGSELWRLDKGAWDLNMKTIYYTYSDTNDIKRSENCLACEG